MPPVPVQAFHDAVVAAVAVDAAEMLDAARGSGPESREMHRALMLADRAARDWAGAAIASDRPEAPNRFEELGQLGKPEDAYHVLEPAARSERDAASTVEQRDIADAVLALARAVQRLDTEASVQLNAPDFREVGQAAAQVLVRSAAVLGDDHFIVDEGNAAMADLVALAGWTNQLGPRFELG